MTRTIRRFIADESGATAVEYGLIVALVSLAAGAMIGTLGGMVENMWGWIRDGVLTAVAEMLA